MLQTLSQEERLTIADALHPVCGLRVSMRVFVFLSVCVCIRSVRVRMSSRVCRCTCLCAPVSWRDAAYLARARKRSRLVRSLSKKETWLRTASTSWNRCVPRRAVCTCAFTRAVDGFIAAVPQGELMATKAGSEGEVCPRLCAGAYFGEIALILDKVRALSRLPPAALCRRVA
jgi:hypothetical protein